MKITIQSWQFWSDWTDIVNNEIETDNYDYFVLENRGEQSDWYLIGYKWVRTDNPKKGYGRWDYTDWSIMHTRNAVQFYLKIPEKINAIKGYWHHKAVKMFIDELEKEAVQRKPII